MTKAEFDDGFKRGVLAVYAPDSENMGIVLDYANRLLGTNRTKVPVVHRFPYLYCSDHWPMGWTGNGPQQSDLIKISFDEFYAAVNEAELLIDEFDDMSELL